MKAVIVYESMFGNTHALASQIANGMRPGFDVTVVSVHDSTEDMVAGADVLVVGGPTHAHGISSARSRQAATTAASNLNTPQERT